MTRELRSALKAVEDGATEDYGHLLALIARDAIEAEAGGCCRCHDGAVAEAIGRVVGASMFSELNVHGRCPPCRDQRVKHNSSAWARRA